MSEEVHVMTPLLFKHLGNPGGSALVFHPDGSGVDWVGFEFSRSKAESFEGSSISDRIYSAASCSSAVRAKLLAWEFLP